MNTKSPNQDEILKKLLEFRKERNWEQFHSPQNIAKSITLEAAELLEIFQWKKTDEELTKEEKNSLADELADVYNWVVLLSHDLELDINEAALNKIEKNRKKYPIQKSKDHAKKYTEL